jgi:molybdopterin/thiamine biosynthesis adenylyltransferase
MELTQAPWFEANPQLLQHELDALAALNIEFAIDSELQRQGILQIGLVIDPANPAFNLSAAQEPVQLKATFPHNYPYFRPEVYGLNVVLPRHQNPIEQNLCLLPRASKHWNVEWTLASFLQAQLSRALEKGEITDEALIAADPTEQAEPVTNYYGGSPVIFDTAAFDAIGTERTELTVLGRIQVGFTNKIIPARMAVLESSMLNQQVLSQLPTVFQELFPVKCEGYALRLAERPPHKDIHDNVRWLKDLLVKHNKGIVPQSRPLAGFKETSINGNAVINHIWALNFPEEVGPGRMGMGWLFLVSGSVEITKTLGKKSTKERGTFACYGQAVRSGAKDTQIRVPHLTHLPDCTVAIVGLGALGGPSAIEFARNQVGGLRLLDFDQVDPATAVRWPLGAPAFGQQKTDALLEFINRQYPRTAVRVIEHKIGKVPIAGAQTEAQALHELLDGASLLFDASAEVGVNHFLSQEAKRRGIPYISLYTTPGAWGGLVMRVVPGKTQGCWMCLQYAKDKAIIPVPKSDATGEVQAPGCGDLTFTGASFDLQNVSLAAVRLAVSTLCADTPGGYPDVNWDVGVVSLVDDNHLSIPPTWQTFPLQADPQCPYCSIS